MCSCKVNTLIKQASRLTKRTFPIPPKTRPLCSHYPNGMITTHVFLSSTSFTQDYTCELHFCSSIWCGFCILIAACIMWIQHSLHTYCTIDGNGGRFQIRAIMNIVFMDILVYVFCKTDIYISTGYRRESAEFAF